MTPWTVAHQARDTHEEFIDSLKYWELNEKWNEFYFEIEIFSEHCLELEKEMQSTPVILPGKSHGRRSQVGCSPWGREELETAEWLHFHFSLSCIGEGNGNPLQCSCLENPRDGGAKWAAVCGVTQIRTRLKRLSSSSSIEVRSHKSSWVMYEEKIFKKTCKKECEWNTSTVRSSYNRSFQEVKQKESMSCHNQDLA